MTSENTCSLVISFKPHSAVWELPAWFMERLNGEFPSVRAVYLRNYEGLDSAIEDAEIFVGLKLQPQQAARAGRLRWIHSLFAAVNWLLTPEIVAGPVVVTCASAVHRIPVAEHALALILALSRRLPACARMQQQRYWGQADIWSDEPLRKEVGGATLGIVGLGGIGLELAGRAKALGMRVLGLRRRSGAIVEHVDEVLGSQGLPDLLSRSDFVVLSLPDTAETRHLIGASEIRQMKRDAYLINVGRGSAIDEHSLADALRQRIIAGAALDVTEVEPLPPDSPLWTAPNLFVTPHVGSATSDQYLWNRQYQVLSDNLRRYLNGEPLAYTVDKQRAY